MEFIGINLILFRIKWNSFRRRVVTRFRPLHRLAEAPETAWLASTSRPSRFSKVKLTQALLKSSSAHPMVLLRALALINFISLCYNFYSLPWRLTRYPSLHDHLPSSNEFVFSRRHVLASLSITFLGILQNLGHSSISVKKYGFVWPNFVIKPPFLRQINGTRKPEIVAEI